MIDGWIVSNLDSVQLEEARGCKVYTLERRNDISIRAYNDNNTVSVALHGGAGCYWERRIEMSFLIV